MKILTIYNIAGISGRDNTEHYIKSLHSIYEQKNIQQKIVVSSCLNKDETIARLKQQFQDLEIIRYNHKFTVNMTFNKTVKIMIEKYGKFDTYLYVDSGVTFIDENAFYKGIESYKQNNYGMASFQVNTDSGYQIFGEDYKNNSDIAQIIEKDKIIPFGTAINLHAQFFSNDIYETYNNIIPDVFVAYCTESTFPFLCASINKKWAIIKDIISTHEYSLDGASSGHTHYSFKYRNTWNNLFGNRDILNLLQDPEALESGIGYEECNKIMLHNQNSYFEDYLPKNRNLLIKKIKQYFFLTKQELDYDKIFYENF